jgi:RnfABCDGE-type electron transport complex G subunit
VRESLRLAGTLTAIALVASLGLAVAYDATHAVKEQYDLAEQERARREVLPDAESAVFEEVTTDSIVSGKPFVYYTARAAEGSRDVLGYTFIAYGKGYSSTLVTMVGVDAAFAVTGISIVSQQETPGLGTKVQEIASRNTLWQVIGGKAVEEVGLRPWFQTQFDGRSEDGLRVVKTRGEDGILAITGATISSEAVTGSVRRGVAMLRSIEAGATPESGAGAAPADGQAGEPPGEATAPAEVEP